MSDHGRVARDASLSEGVPSRHFVRAVTCSHRLQEVAARLTERFPDVAITIRGWGLHFAAAGENGYPIWFELIDGIPTVTLRDFQFEFASIESASQTVALALTKASQLRIEQASPRVLRWWLETVHMDETPRTVLAGGMGWSAFRRNWRMAIYYNNLKEASERVA